MRIVVSGTHASGKSTLIADFHDRHPEHRVLGDPFDDIDDEQPAGTGSFVAQLRVTASRLAETAADPHVISERGPLDFVAYLAALNDLGRDDGALLPRAREIAKHTLSLVDLVVLVPLDGAATIHVPADEDPELRVAMDAALLDLADELDGDGLARFVTVGGDRGSRLRTLLAAAEG